MSDPALPSIIDPIDMRSGWNDLLQGTVVQGPYAFAADDGANHLFKIVHMENWARPWFPSRDPRSAPLGGTVLIFISSGHGSLHFGVLLEQLLLHLVFRHAFVQETLSPESYALAISSREAVHVLEAVHGRDVVVRGAAATGTEGALHDVGVLQ